MLFTLVEKIFIREMATINDSNPRKAPLDSFSSAWKEWKPLLECVSYVNKFQLV
ncbi:unnamed protein product [Nezara viridula]|uniref:Uncharacterized protein n=1 Tax=Nezara viridula TaxID=85310 RepID=A0A9P0H3X5_NEZVI|nr:unnamed protein product [Nezara viridula]